MRNAHWYFDVDCWQRYWIVINLEETDLEKTNVNQAAVQCRTCWRVRLAMAYPYHFCVFEARESCHRCARMPA